MTEKDFKQIFPLGEKNDAYAQYFVGQSYLSMLTTERVGIANVTFEPGCRNNWHIHHKGGQILLCTAGRGYYQEWGKPAQEMNPGDVINIAPEVKHWHGALLIAGFLIWRWRSRQKEVLMNGWNR